LAHMAASHGTLENLHQLSASAPPPLAAVVD
jgi:hypothetical protein